MVLPSTSALWLALVAVTSAIPFNVSSQFRPELADATANFNLPVVQLPSGSWQATAYDSTNDVYTFSNIRFGKPPVGSLRFAKPEKPDPTQDVVQNGGDGNDCVGYVPRNGLNFAGVRQNASFAGPLNWIVPRIMGLSLNTGAEDCLFLDVYVPGKMFRGQVKQKVPVVNWIHGGAFLFGSKTTTGIYSGTHLVGLSKGNMIFVAANYRLGVYGWLAGPTVEEHGTANLGLYDQRLAFEWIRDNIEVFGGDPSRVSAWGESAGASSIMHHLIAFGGRQDPLFYRAALFSPAFQPMGDRTTTGAVETTFQRLNSWGGCQDTKGLRCLQKVDSNKLVDLNRRLQEAAPHGSYAIGPASDGSWVKHFAGVEFLQGNYWKNLDSLIISHTTWESTIYTDGNIQSDRGLDSFLRDLFGDHGTRNQIVENVRRHYPPVADGSGPYKTVTERAMDLIRDAAFTCNARFVEQAYRDRVWGMVFGGGTADNGWHGTDLAALFLRANSKIGGSTIPILPGIGAMSRLFQTYFVSHAITGDPNKLAIGENSLTSDDYPRIKPIFWPQSPKENGNNMDTVLVEGDNNFTVGVDYNVPKDKCDFWQTYLASWR